MNVQQNLQYAIAELSHVGLLRTTDTLERTYDRMTTKTNNNKIVIILNLKIDNFYCLLHYIKMRIPNEHATLKIWTISTSSNRRPLSKQIIGNDNTRSFLHLSPVSYTHLDVYKRQVYALMF